MKRMNRKLLFILLIIVSLGGRGHGAFWRPLRRARTGLNEFAKKWNRSDRERKRAFGDISVVTKDNITDLQNALLEFDIRTAHDASAYPKEFPTGIPLTAKEINKIRERKENKIFLELLKNPNQKKLFEHFYNIKKTIKEKMGRAKELERFPGWAAKKSGTGNQQKAHDLMLEVIKTKILNIDKNAPLPDTDRANKAKEKFELELLVTHYQTVNRILPYLEIIFDDIRQIALKTSEKEYRRRYTERYNDLVDKSLTLQTKGEEEAFNTFIEKALKTKKGTPEWINATKGILSNLIQAKKGQLPEARERIIGMERKEIDRWLEQWTEDYTNRELSSRLAEKKKNLKKEISLRKWLSPFSTKNKELGSLDEQKILNDIITDYFLKEPPEGYLEPDYFKRNPKIKDKLRHLGIKGSYLKNKFELYNMAIYRHLASASELWKTLQPYLKTDEASKLLDNYVKSTGGDFFGEWKKKTVEAILRAYAPKVKEFAQKIEEVKKQIQHLDYKFEKKLGELETKLSGALLPLETKLEEKDPEAHEKFLTYRLIIERLLAEKLDSEISMLKKKVTSTGVEKLKEKLLTELKNINAVKEHLNKMIKEKKNTVLEIQNMRKHAKERLRSVSKQLQEKTKLKVEEKKRRTPKPKREQLPKKKRLPLTKKELKAIQKEIQELKHESKEKWKEKQKGEESRSSTPPIEEEKKEIKLEYSTKEEIEKQISKTNIPAAQLRPTKQLPKPKKTLLSEEETTALNKKIEDAKKKEPMQEMPAEHITALRRYEAINENDLDTSGARNSFEAAKKIYENLTSGGENTTVVKYLTAKTSAGVIRKIQDEEGDDRKKEVIKKKYQQCMTKRIETKKASDEELKKFNDFLGTIEGLIAVYKKSEEKKINE